MLRYLFLALFGSIYFFNSGSAREHGTLYQLKNVINRTHVTKPKANFNACDDFFEIIITGYILGAAMEVLGMKSLDDTPSDVLVQSPETAWMGSNLEREDKLREISMHIVHTFINNKTPSFSEDNVHNYSTSVLSIGCLYFEMRDAIREGDGDRALQCWKYLLPLFHNSCRQDKLYNRGFPTSIPIQLRTTTKTSGATEMESFCQHTRPSWKEHPHGFTSGAPESNVQDQYRGPWCK